MWGSIAVAIAELGKLGNKIMEWFSPAQVEKKWKAELDELEREKKNLLSQPPTYARACGVAKIQNRINELRSKLHS